MTSSASPTPVPFLDLSRQAPAVGEAVRAAVLEVLASRQYVLGPAVTRFEAAMAEYAGVQHAIGVGSGTDALALCLQALGVGPGVRVLTTAFSFFATASTIVRVGGTPVFADIDPVTFNLSPAAAEAALTASKPVAGLLPVHLFGRLVDTTQLGALAASHGAWLLEDAAQAVGARRDGRAAGGFGVAGCLSFYPTKNLGGAGDGGMILTSDAALAGRLRQDRHHGQVAPYEHARIGACSRLDGVQAAALWAKLRWLDDWNAARRQVAQWYRDAFTAAGLAGDPIVLPPDEGSADVWHVFTVRAPRRDALVGHLQQHGVGTQVYYRIPLHRQPPIVPHAEVPLPLPETERAAAEVVALPIFPELTQTEVARVVDVIARFYAGAR